MPIGVGRVSGARGMMYKWRPQLPKKPDEQKKVLNYFLN